MSEKKTVREQITAWLEETRRKASEFCKDFEQLKTDTKADLETKRAALERKMASARERLKTLGEHEAEACNELKKGVSSAWKELEEAGRRALKSARGEGQEG